MEALDGFKALVRLFIGFQEFFGAFDGIFSLAQQVVDEVEVFDIDRSEMAVAFLVLTGLENIEFRFPKTEEGLVYTEHFGYLPHGIVLLAEEDLVRRDLDEVGLGRYLLQRLAAPFGLGLFGTGGG